MTSHSHAIVCGAAADCQQVTLLLVLESLSYTTSASLALATLTVANLSGGGDSPAPLNSATPH